jgi:hypothetical protein
LLHNLLRNLRLDVDTPMTKIIDNLRLIQKEVKSCHAIVSRVGSKTGKLQMSSVLNKPVVDTSSNSARPGGQKTIVPVIGEPGFNAN